MVEKTMDLIVTLNFIGLIGLLAGIRWWQKKHGKLTEKKFALIITGFWTFFFITSLYPVLVINFKVIILVEIVLLLLFWGIGYPWSRWIYRQFNSSKC
jgi:hypothetical protein